MWAIKQFQQRMFFFNLMNIVLGKSASWVKTCSYRLASMPGKNNKNSTPNKANSNERLFSQPIKCTLKKHARHINLQQTALSVNNSTLLGMIKIWAQTNCPKRKPKVNICSAHHARSQQYQDAEIRGPAAESCAQASSAKNQTGAAGLIAPKLTRDAHSQSIKRSPCRSRIVFRRSRARRTQIISSMRVRNIGACTTRDGSCDSLNNGVDAAIVPIAHFYLSLSRRNIHEHRGRFTNSCATDNNFPALLLSDVMSTNSALARSRGLLSWKKTSL